MTKSFSNGDTYSDRLSEFKVYLCSAGTTAGAQSLRQKLGEMRLQILHEKFRPLILLGTATPGLVEAALGTPHVRSDNTLEYRIPGRPSYRYVFQFTAEAGVLCESGFRRDGPPPSLSPASNRSHLGPRLHPEVATSAEALAFFGPPAQRYGWWPDETWEWDTGFALAFRHGLVVR
jgi:hypothetical protein